MKILTNNLTIIFLVFFCIGAFAQSSPASEVTQVYSNASTTNSTAENTSSKKTALFEEAAYIKGIPQRKLTTLDKVDDGYYIIAGVFGKSRNAKKAVRKYKKMGL